jgi:hypothetical protein
VGLSRICIGSAVLFSFFLLSSLLIPLVFGSSTMWSKTYGEGIALSLVETSDRGFAIAGTTNGNFCLVKTDAYGNFEWNQTYGEGIANSLIETSDVIAGHNGLVKTDEHGNIEWECTYSGSARSLVESSYGGFAIAGFLGSLIDDEESDFWLIKTDEQGNMEWNKTYGGADMEVANSLIETSDGGYALAGLRTGLEGVIGFHPFDNTLWLVKTDNLGNMEWNQTYGEKSGFKDANSLVETSDGGYAIAGYIPDTFGYADFWLIKTDESGNMEWNRTYGGEGNEHALSLVVTSDGGFALTGFTSGQGLDALLVKTDAYGNMEWSQTIGEARYEQAFSLVESSDGGYAIAGYATSSDAIPPGPPGPQYFWLVKTDEYGNVPEFPSLTPLLIMLVAVMAVAVVYRRRLLKQNQRRDEQ